MKKMVESLWTAAERNCQFSAIPLPQQKSTNCTEAARQTSTQKRGRILMKNVLASSYSQGKESIFCQYLLLSERLMHGLMHYPFSAENLVLE